MTLSGEKVLGQFNFGSSDKYMSKASRGELQCIAGHRAYFGHGTKQNFEKAFECYLKSAELGNADGMNHAAQLYEKGIGCIKNVELAIKYYQAAVELQNDVATIHLAKLYFDNFVYKDVDKAIKYYKQVQYAIPDCTNKYFQYLKGSREWPCCITKCIGWII